MTKRVGALLSLLCAAGMATAAPETAREATRNTAEALDFELSDGRKFVRLSELPARTTVVNFWRSDCPPCVREMPVLAALAGDGTTRVVAVAVQKHAETLAAPATVRAALRPPVLSLHAPSEPRGLLARFGNPRQALPHTVVLDAARRVCATKTGEIDAAWLAAAVQRCR